MSRASNLAKAIGADGTLNVSDVAGLAAVASSGSASDLSTGTLPIARIADGAVTYAKLSSDVQGDMNQFKNRIINGAMVIDQRNAGASLNNDTSGSQFIVDRWNIFGQQSAKFSAQQSTTVPAGFRNSLLFTSLSAYTPLTGDRFIFRHKIEGYNMSDFNWGTANAQTATFSFWVRSSLTGTFGGVLMNDTQGRCFPFTYTISAANTWEQKTVTVAGDTTGTWETGNLTGLQIWFSLGAGATYIAPSSGSWIAGNYTAPPGAQNFVATNGATLHITGVQLEKGSTATSFDYRPYGTELQLCQRYFQYSHYYFEYNMGATGSLGGPFLSFVTAMRASPTFTVIATSGSNTTVNGTFSYTVNGVSYGYQIGYSSASSGYGYRDTTYSISSEL